MILPQTFIAVLEVACNRYLALDDELLPKLATFAGKIIAIELVGVNATLFLFPSADGIMILSDFDGAADTTIHGTPLALAKLGMFDDSAAVMFSGEVRISGDVRLGHQFQKILQHMHIDWEQQLSRYVGDVAAHQIYNSTQQVGSWLKRNFSSFSLDMGEYLQEESQLVVGKAELDKFASQVDDLRNAIARLEMRMQRVDTKP